MKTDFQLHVMIGWKKSGIVISRHGKIFLCRLLSVTGTRLIYFLQKELNLSEEEVLNVLGEQGYIPSKKPLSVQEQLNKAVPLLSVVQQWFQQILKEAEIVWKSLPFYGNNVEKQITVPFSRWWPLSDWTLTDGFFSQTDKLEETPLSYVSVSGDSNARLASLKSKGKIWTIEPSVQEGQPESVLLKGKDRTSGEVCFLLDCFTRFGLAANFQKNELSDNCLGAEFHWRISEENISRLNFILKQAITGLDFYVAFPAYKPVKKEKAVGFVSTPCVIPEPKDNDHAETNFVQLVGPREIKKGFYEVTEGFFPRDIPSFFEPSLIGGYMLKLQKNQNSFVRASRTSKTGCMVVFPAGEGLLTTQFNKAVSSVVAEAGQAFTGYYVFNRKTIFSRLSYTADFIDLKLKGVRREAAALIRKLGVSAVLIKEFETGRIFVLEK